MLPFGVTRHTAALAFRRDGRLVVGSEVGIVRMVDPATGRELARLNRSARLTSNDQILLSPDGSVLVTTGSEGVTRWDLHTNRPLWSTPVADDRCANAALAVVIDSVLCGSRLGRVMALDLATGVPTARSYDMQRGDVSALTLTGDGNTLVELTATVPVIARWRLDGTGPITSLLPVRGAPGQYNADGRMLVASSAAVGSSSTGYPEVVDAQTGAVVQRLAGYVSPVWTADPSVLVAWNQEGDGYLIDIRTHRALGQLAGSLGGPPDAGQASFREDRLLVWGIGFSRYVKDWRVWDTRNGAIVAGQKSPFGWDGASLSADGRVLVAAGGGRIAAYDLAAGKVTAQNTGVVNAAVSPTNVVATATTDGALAFYDIRTLRPSGPSLPGTGGIRQFSFDADGGLLAVAGLDGRVRLVDMNQHAQLGDPIDLGASADQSIALRPDGAALALPSPAGTVIWQLRPQIWARAACQFAGRNLTPQEWRTYLAGLGDYVATCPKIAQR